MNEISKLNLPDDSIRYVLWQRAEYRSPFLQHFISFAGRILGGKNAKSLYMKYLVGSWFEKSRSSEISDLYLSNLTKIMTVMRPKLPNHCDRILDIGCGLGGIDVLLYHQFSTAPNEHVELWMLDKDDDSPLRGGHYAGFTDTTTAAYNSLDVTRNFLEANKVPSNRIQLVNIEQDSFPSSIKFDLVLSLLSWGFHYPVDVYLEKVVQSLKSSGALFIDIRRDTDGMDKLKSAFKEVNVVHKGKKNLFVCAQSGIE